MHGAHAGSLSGVAATDLEGIHLLTCLGSKPNVGPRDVSHLFPRSSAKRKKNGLLTPADTAMGPRKAKDECLSA